MFYASTLPILPTTSNKQAGMHLNGLLATIWFTSLNLTYQLELFYQEYKHDPWTMIYSRIEKNM